jgi:hypothetical protein
MLMDGIEYGQPVEGVSLLRHGPGPRQIWNRRSIAIGERLPPMRRKDRNACSWYECTICLGFKLIRDGSVRPGITKSCGCKARECFVRHFEQRAENLSASAKNVIFAMMNGGLRLKGAAIAKLLNLRTREVGFRLRNFKARLKTTLIATLLKLPRYVVDFAYAARCAMLRTFAGASKLAKSALTKIERVWLRNEEHRLSLLAHGMFEDFVFEPGDPDCLCACA